MENTKHFEKDHELLLKKRKVKYAVRKTLGSSMRAASYFLPYKFRLALAKRSTRFGHLLSREQSVILRNYLGSLSLNVDPNTDIGRAIIAEKYETELLQTISNYVHHGDICIDVGANIGALSLALCQRIKKNGKVLCFEPGPKFFKQLEANFSLNQNLSSIARLHNLGLSNQEGNLLWMEDSAFPGNAWLLGNQGVPVKVISLDSFLKNNPIPHLDFMKIDVEGMELEVLKGAEETVKKFRPILVVESEMSFETIRGQQIRKELEEYLHSLGYRLYHLPGHEPLRKAQYPHFPQNIFAIGC